MPTYLTIFGSHTVSDREKPCGSYKLRHADYEFSRSVNRRGEAASDVSGGVIRVVLSGFGDESLFRWLFDLSHTLNGQITTTDEQEKVLDKIHFTHGRAVKYRLHYDASTKNGASAILLIHAAEIITDNGAVF